MQIIKMKRVITILMSLFVSFSVNAQTKDFVILGGELSNSAATSVSDIDEVLPRMKALGLNTVLVPVYWEFLEPVEGQMDFTLEPGRRIARHRILPRTKPQRNNLQSLLSRHIDGTVNKCEVHPTLSWLHQFPIDRHQHRV